MQEDLRVRVGADVTGFQSAMRQAGSSLENFKSKVFSIRGAMASLGVYFAYGKVKDVALTAARYETLGVSMEQVGKSAGYSKHELDYLEKSLRKTGISMIESRQNLMRMISSQMDLSHATKLARVAQDAAVIANENSSATFQRLVYAIQSGQIEMLRTVGINVSFEKSYKELATTLNKTSKELTEVEKTQARMNAVLEFGTTIAGSYESAMSTAGKQLNSFARYIDDWKVVAGEAFGPALVEILKVAKEQIDLATESTAKWAKENKELIGQKTKEYLTDTIGALKTFKSIIESILDIYNAMPEDLRSGIIPGLLFGKVFGKNIGLFIGAMAVINSVMSKFGAGIGDLVDAHKAAQKAIEDLWYVLSTGKRPYPIDLKTYGAHEVKALDAQSIFESLDIDTVAPHTIPPKPVTPSYDKAELLKKYWATKGKEAQEAQMMEFEPTGGAALQEDLNVATNIKEKMKEITEGFKEYYMEYYASLTQGSSLLELQSSLEIEAVRTKYDKMIEYLQGYAGKEEEINTLRAQKADMITMLMAKKEEALNALRLSQTQEMASNLAQTFEYLGQAGVMSSRKAFEMQKAFAVIEAMISAHKAAAEAFARGGGYPWGVAMAAVSYAMGLARVAAISSQAPPTYDSGGVSREPGMYYAGVPEAHIPLPSGGKIPVELNSGGDTNKEVHIHINNNITAMDAYTFMEFTQRNPGAITGPLITALNDHTGLRYSIKEALK